MPITAYENMRFFDPPPPEKTEIHWIHRPIKIKVSTIDDLRKISKFANFDCGPSGRERSAHLRET